MKKVFWIILMILGLGGLPAGQAGLSAQSFVKPYNAGFNQNRSVLSNDTLKILAVMVDFQEDKYDATIGTGKFGSHYTQAYGDTILDPLPHNANYFSDHLLFAKNYYQKVSRGKLNISYKVLPEVITVSKNMRDYVPAYQSKDFTPLANFASEVWKLADAKYSNIKFSDYNLFIIFHAGVSSGLDLGIFSIDRNMPSLYLGLNAFKKVFGDQFSGIPTRSGKVINSIILPETESRELTAIDNSKILQQITINGELVNNMGNFLGLPDLFDTETGLSAIGRFGLMDGQAISANYGMFPPEPSPWGKMFLGWEQPVTLSINKSHPGIAARLTALIQDTTLLKIPINSTEYFLVENREQDAKKDNLIITYRRNDSTLTKEVFKDTSGLFTVIPKTLHGGVVIDVDEYDAAVPGNGIVIWHIDEKIINEKIAENKINADPNARGVYVEEADGIQDIGVKYTSYFGTFIGEGTNEDFWYAGNKAKLYKNRFASDTKPNTNSTSGSNSLITINNFSVNSNKMSFSVDYNSGNIKLVSSTKLNIGQNKIFLSARSYSFQNFIYVIENSNLLKYDLNGNLLKTIPNFSDIQPIIFDYNSTQYVIGGKGTLLNIYWKNTQEEKIKTLDCTGQRITALSIDLKKAGVPDILMALWIPNARAYLIPLDVLLNMNSFNVSANSILDSNNEITNFGVDNSFYTILGSGNLYEYSANPKNLQLSNYGFGLKSILTKDKNGNYISIILLKDNKFIIASSGNILFSFPIKTENAINSFAVSDLFNDGQNYILISNGSSIEAYNFEGVMAKNFPFTITQGENFVSTPLAVDLDRDGFSEVIGFTDKGNIIAISPITGKLVDGFPILSGANISTTPILIAEELPTMGPLPTYKPYLALIDQTNQLYVWNLSPTQGKSYWSGEYGDAVNSSFVTAPSLAQQVTDFFPINKAYNWPNPVYGSSTNIRYYVSEDSDVKIKIVDLAGELVAEINNKARGGFDNETVWDVSKIQSGIYYAYIEVKSSSGNSANKIIKIAVIK
ncbi:MAG: T9SS type A sorting domain-containing protein [Ignavibacteriales bacterium]|nr:T9SS type A sorting domain-containing protein [Ignavibacteriales bacterium]